MSIINDALKKTKQSINTDNVDPEVEAILRKKRIKNKIKVILLYLLAIGVGIYIGNFFFGFLGKSKSLSRLANKPLPTAQRQFGAEVGKQTTVAKVKETLLGNVPLLRKEPKQPLILNGVFFSQDEACALINNRVVKVGDEIEGATVRKIDADKVELEIRGSKITLSTR
jgi:type II secretory pathway component PulC